MHGVPLYPPTTPATVSDCRQGLNHQKSSRRRVSSREVARSNSPLSQPQHLERSQAEKPAVPASRTESKPCLGSQAHGLLGGDSVLERVVARPRHTHTHSLTYTNTQTHTQTHTHTNPHTRTDTDVRTHTHTFTRTLR